MTSRPDLAVLAATSGHSGVDRVLTNLVPALAADGLAVHVLSIDGHGPHYRSLPDDVTVIRLGTAHVNTSLWPLIRYLRRYRPRVLLTDKDKVNRLALLARRLAGVPTRIAIRIGTTVSINLARRSAISRWSQRLSIRLFYRHADVIVVPSQGVADDLATLAALPVNRISVVANPVVDERLYRRMNEPLAHRWFADPAIPILLGAGELSARKDFATLLRAFARVRQQRRCRLIILGEGRKRQALTELAAELGIADDIDLPGFADNPYPYMARAAVFALTSVCEGSGIVLVEALAVGTPVVSTDCPSGPRETLQDGQFGELVAVGDDRALAAAIIRTLDQRLPSDYLEQAILPFTVATAAGNYRRALQL